MTRRAVDMGMQMICMVVGMIVAYAVTMVVMAFAVIVMMMVMRMAHCAYSTSGPAGIETGLSMIDLCAPILPWETSVPSTSTMTRVASSAVMSEVS